MRQLSGDEKRRSSTVSCFRRVWLRRGISLPLPLEPLSRANIGGMADRGGANLCNPGAQAGEGPRDDRLIRKVAKAVAIHIALIKARHRRHAAIRRKAGQRTGENRFVGNVHYAVVVHVAALAGVADPVGR